MFVRDFVNRLLAGVRNARKYNQLMSWFSEGQQRHLLSIIDELQLIHAKVINSCQTRHAKQRNVAFYDERVDINLSLLKTVKIRETVSGNRFPGTVFFSHVDVGIHL